MNRNLKIFIAAVFLFCAAITFTVKTRANYSNENSQNNFSSSFAQKSVPAKTLYVNNCARCHGADGKANTELGQLYSATDLTSRGSKRLSRKKAASIILNGKGSMPAFNKKLSAKDAAALVGYIKSL